MAGNKLDELQAFFGAEGRWFGYGESDQYGNLCMSDGCDVQVRDLLTEAMNWKYACATARAERDVALEAERELSLRIAELESELRATVAAGNAAAEPAYRRIAELEAENAGLKSAIDTQAAIIAQHENAEGDAVSRARQDVREHMWRMETDRDNKVMELRAENAMLRETIKAIDDIGNKIEYGDIGAHDALDEIGRVMSERER